MNAGGADSAKSTFRRLVAEERQYPERYFMNREGILGYAASLKQQGKPDQAAVLLEMARERYREYCETHASRCH
jgi:hypothetical protein